MRAKGFCLVLLVAGTLAAGCASSSSAATAATNEQVKNYGQDVATMAPAPAATVGDFGGANATPAPAAEPGVAAASGAAPAASSNAAQPENQIIKTGTISIQVTAVDDSIGQATDQMHALGGWLAGSDRTTRTSSDMASVTYRIPVNRFEDALAAMRKLGVKILSEHTESTPVGGEIVDLQSRIANLRASEKAIQAIMAKAITIGDVLTVEQRLAEVQGQIEQLSGQLTGLTDQSAYSTLTVVFMVPILPTPSPSPTPTPSPSPSPSPTAAPIAWNAGTQAGQAAAALGDVGTAVATVLIWAAILVVPVALAFIIFLALLGFAGRRLDPYRKRLLPFTVANPVTYQQPLHPQGWFVPGVPGVPGAPVVPGAQPDDKPKA
jgi:hypothetical protein